VDQSVLVNIEIQRGADVVAALDQAKVKVSAALFASLAEYGDWRMVLAARAFDELGLRKAYGLIFESLTAAEIGPEKTPSILIFPMNEPFVRDIRRMYGKSKNVEGLILRSQSFGARFVEGAYVYRIR
jgi:ribonucleotide reductase beta subunit family protein with ferritin-like domain